MLSITGTNNVFNTSNVQGVSGTVTIDNTYGAYTFTGSGSVKLLANVTANNLINLLSCGLDLNGFTLTLTNGDISIFNLDTTSNIDISNTNSKLVMAPTWGVYIEYYQNSAIAIRNATNTISINGGTGYILNSTTRYTNSVLTSNGVTIPITVGTYTPIVSNSFIDNNFYAKVGILTANSSAFAYTATFPSTSTGFNYQLFDTTTSGLIGTSGTIAATPTVSFSQTATTAAKYLQLWFWTGTTLPTTSSKPSNFYATATFAVVAPPTALPTQPASSTTTTLNTATLTLVNYLLPKGNISENTANDMVKTVLLRDSIMKDLFTLYTITRQAEIANISTIVETTPALLIPFANFPFTFTEISNLNTNVTNVRIIDCTANDTIFDLSLKKANEMIYANFTTGGDTITFKSGTASLKIKLNGTTAKGLYGANTYTVTGATTGNGATAADGAVITLGNFNFVLGDVTGNENASGNPCFQKGTNILTPEGYKPVEELKNNDLILSTKKVNISIKKMVHFIGKKEDSPLYCLPKNALAENRPQTDLYMSGDHAYKYNDSWKHMNCSDLTQLTEQEDIEYYHIVIDDYFAHTIIAENVEVETCFKQEGVNEKTLMLWSCDNICCTPLKCQRTKIPAPSVVPIENNYLLNTVKGEKKKKSMIVWAANPELNTNIPFQCDEIKLPN